jgi:hypothetical protein
VAIVLVKSPTSLGFGRQASGGASDVDGLPGPAAQAGARVNTIATLIPRANRVVKGLPLVGRIGGICGFKARWTDSGGDGIPARRR